MSQLPRNFGKSVGSSCERKWRSDRQRVKPNSPHLQRGKTAAIVCNCAVDLRFMDLQSEHAYFNCCNSGAYASRDECTERFCWPTFAYPSGSWEQGESDSIADCDCSCWERSRCTLRCWCLRLCFADDRRLEARRQLTHWWKYLPLWDERIYYLNSLLSHRSFKFKSAWEPKRLLIALNVPLACSIN